MALEPTTPTARVNVRSLDPVGNPCGCVHSHAPVPDSNDCHHIVPRAWGGPDVKANKRALCPTGHDKVHRILDDFLRHGGVTPKGRRNAYLYDLAVQGWDNRPRR